MGTRRKSRELALQSLYQSELTGVPAVEAFTNVCGNFRVTKTAVPYAGELVHGIAGNFDEINRLITAAAENWRLERMSVIDRNIIRLAVYEIFFQGGVPARVAINEAVELAKQFGTDESAAFINGVLDAVNPPGPEKAGI